ncbi:MAG: ABC transporter permease [Cyanobacteriota bacterium]|nr:ABC transporter permease [Cyanobacteriota bacterium]
MHPSLSRDLATRLEQVLLPLGAILLALMLFGVFCAFQGLNPWDVYGSIYTAGFGRWPSLQNALLRAAPLMLCSLCTLLPGQVGLMVIGNEGALLVGALTATGMGLLLRGMAPVVAQGGMAVAGLVGGGLWIGLLGWMKAKRGVNETIAGLLLNYVAIALLNFLVEGPLRDPASLNHPASFPLAETHLLANLPGMRVHGGIVAGVIACLLCAWLLYRTPLGFAARITGGNPRAAQIVGLPVDRLLVTFCLLGGAAAGLAGMVEVAAVHGRANDALIAGYGYGGVLVAFVARQNPLLAIVVSVLLGGILASGGILQRAHDLPDATVLIFQGLVFLCVLWSESFYGKLQPRLQRWFQGGGSTGVPPSLIATGARQLG